MNASELLDLLSQEEGIKLDFKQKYELNHIDQKVRTLHWNELIKDILALTNGNVGASNQPGYLIVGAGNEPMPDGTRKLFDVRKQGLKLSRQQLIEKVNTYCHPPLVDLFYSEVEIERNWIGVIKLPPSPFVHETTRRLETPKSTYSEGTVLIRRTEGIYPATQSERDALLNEKQKLKDHIAIKNLDDIEVRYKRHLVVQHRELDFQGLMQTARPLALSLKDIYISLHAVGDVPETDTMILEQSGFQDSIDGDNALSLNHVFKKEDESRNEQQVMRTRRQNIAEILARDHACVILGEPGAGKTTILRYVALVLAEGDIERRLRLKGKKLPILVPLASYEAALRSDDSLTPNMYLARYYEQEHALKNVSSLFEYYLSRGEAIVLFDGLDEVLTLENRVLIARRVKTFVDVATSQGNKIVITSRIVGYREAPLPGYLPHYTVLNFNQKEIQQFVMRWCHAYEVWLANEASEEVRHKSLIQSRQLIEAIHSNPGIENLATNPLLLTILALIHRQEKKLPHRRVELYEVYVRTLIERWGRTRSLSGRTISPLSLDYYKLVKILAPLALWMQRERASGTARRVEVVRHIKLVMERMGYESAEAQDEAEQLLDDLRRYSGLLVERGRDAYGFTHLTFQEYFAARAIAMMRPNEQIKVVHDHLHDPRWREVILLTAGQIGNVDLREEEISELVSSILNANSWGNQHTHQDTFLAASCLADDVSLDVSTTREIIDKLGQLLKGNIRLLAEVAADYLGQCFSAPMRKRVISIIMSALLSEYSWSRIEAAKVLAKIRSQDDEVINNLLLCLDDSDVNIREASVYALGEIGKPSKQILDKLREVEQEIGFVATEAIRQLEARIEVKQPKSQKPANPLSIYEAEIKELTGLEWGQPINFDELPENNLVNLLGYYHYRDSALLALIKRESLKTDTVHQIVARLTQYGRYERRGYYETLVDIPYCNSQIIEALVAEMRSSQWQVQQAAIRALGKLGREKRQLLDIFLDTLANAKWQIKQASARAIGEFGESDERIDKALLTATYHSRWEVRQAAVRSLGQVGTCGQTIANRLIDALSDEVWLVRWTAFKVFPQYSKRCKINIDLLAEVVVKHHSVLARHSATCLIGEFKEITPQVMIAILKATYDESEIVRQAAVAVLGELGQWNVDVHQTLRNNLNDVSLDVRGNAANALVTFEVKDTTLESHLVEALTKSERQRIRDASVKNLGKYGTSSLVTIRALLQYSMMNSYWRTEREPGIQALSDLSQRDLAGFLTIFSKAKFTEKQKRVLIGVMLETLAQTQQLYDKVRTILLTLTHSKKWDLRAFAATALAYSNQDDDKTISQLKLLLYDDDVRVRDAAIYALSRIAGSPYLEKIAVQPYVWEEGISIYGIPF